MAEGSVITEKGRALLGKILATNSTLNITGAQIGSSGVKGLGTARIQDQIDASLC